MPAPPNPTQSTSAAAPATRISASEQAGYIDLGSSFPSWNIWSNNPAHMKLPVYFNLPVKASAGSSGATAAKNNPPNIGYGFDLGALRPMLVQRDEQGIGAGDTYVSADEKGNYFWWNEGDGRMYQWVGQPKQDDVVTDVLTGPNWGKLKEVPRKNNEARQGA
ncbi:hypothetical protein MMC11_008965 [Xylographa trunciseda]|nr:hypothetical protein [Xylographa trunciseda]